MKNTMNMRSVGEKVSINDPKFPGIWTVKSIGPVNAVLIPEGGGRGLRCPHWMVTDPGAPVAQPTVIEKHYVPGELVRVEVGKYPGLYTVIADKGSKINIALLGGDGGRYVRASRTMLIPVEPSEVLV